ncbi:MAG: YCF48-related protein [bacterium]
MAVLLFGAARADALGWSAQPSPTTLPLYGVSFSTPSTWVAVGDGGTILQSTDGGIGWATVPSPVGDALRAVSFLGNVGVAVGIAGRVVRSTDAGASWVQEPRPTTKALYSVSMGANTAVITGEEGRIFFSTDAGLTWAARFAGTASVLFGVSVNGSTAVGVGGAGAVVMSTNGGDAWGLTIIGTPLTFFYGTSFASPSTGWLVGTSDVVPSIIARSTSGGFTWTAQTSPTAEGLFGVSFPSLDVGTAVGTNGAIIHTADGGQHWNVQPSGVTQTLNAVSFADLALGIAVGDGGTILRTTTGGSTGVDEGSALRSVAALECSANPFRASTTLRFTTRSAGAVSLKVFNVLGEEVATLASGDLAPGTRAATWDASGLPAGTYFARLLAQGIDETRKLTLVR